MERQNVTISLPKSLVKKAKIVAAQRDTSLSALIRESLEEKVRKGTGYREAMEAELRLMDKGFHLGSGGRMPCTREDLHERR